MGEEEGEIVPRREEPQQAGGTAMSQERQLAPFFDLKKYVIVKGGSFFLEYILKARTDLHMDTGCHKYDEELNVYLAGLLNLLSKSDSFLRQKPYLSPFDLDVQQWLETHPGLRNAFVAYRDNADFGLLLLGLFGGYRHEGSYHNIVIGDSDNKHERVALYYELAASALTHLHGHQGSLIDVFEALSEQVHEIIRLLQYISVHYLELKARISDGSFFHLEREMNASAQRKLFNEKMDEFLKCYSAYKEQPSDEAKGLLLTMAEEMRKLNSDFKFDGKL
jgi:hypothetical protein